MQQSTALKQLSRMRKLSKKFRLAGQGWKNDFQHLIAIILSARTRDETTILVCNDLFKRFPNPKKLSKAKTSDVERIIKKVNFYKNKSKSIIQCSRSLLEKFHGKVPRKIEELITLPGVGRKTANVFLSERGEKGIGVDTHVFYISRYLGWTKSKDPHKVEEELKSLFQKKYWNKINPTLVQFGKTYTSRREKDKLLSEIRKIN